MEKKIIIALTTVMIAFGGSLVHADDVAVTIDGQYLSMDVPARIMNERTMVPMRAIFEALGATVDWDGDSQQIRADAGETSILMQIDSPHMYVASDTRSDVITLDQPPVIIEGRTLVPARAISEALDANVGWDGANSTVNIDSGNAIMASPAYFYKGNVYYSLADEPSIYVWDGNTNYRYAAGGKVQGIVVYNDYIFYYNSTSNNICRMDLDGTNRQILASTNYSSSIDPMERAVFAIQNNTIIFPDEKWDSVNDGQAPCRIYSVDINGGNKQILVEYNDINEYGNFGRFYWGHSLWESRSPWTVNKRYIYYGFDSGNYDDYRYYRYSLETSKIESIDELGIYSLLGTDMFGNIILEETEESDTYPLYTINEPSTSAIPYSNLHQYENIWFYYGAGNVCRKQFATGTWEILADGIYMGNDNETIMYRVNTLKNPDFYNSAILNQQIYVMDVDGNNIRLVNEYSNGSAVQSNTAFDNTQPANQQTTCAVCHGLGYYDCQICHGEGTVKKYTRAGLEVKTCTHCGGRKRITCTVCGGDGILHN